MKAKFLKLSMLLLFMGGLMTIEAQGLYNLATLDEESNESPLTWTSGANFGYDDAYEDLDEGVGWAQSTLGGSVGFGWNDNDGNSETSFCVGAEYLTKVLGEDKNPNGAGYLGAFATYHNSSGDSFDESSLKIGSKFSYFDRITALNEAQLIYGAKAYYETGSRDFSGFKDDVSGYGASLYAGFNIRLCDKAWFGVEFPVISWASRTFKANGNEFKQDNISAAINKDNPLTASIRWDVFNKKIREAQEFGDDY